MEENKSQLAKDLEQALFVCSLRDDLSRLTDDESIQDEHTKQVIWKCFCRAMCLLADSLDTKEIRTAQIKKRMGCIR